jgi:hypothetical protein
MPQICNEMEREVGVRVGKTEASIVEKSIQ